jgi:hypothetical protein
MRCGRERCIFTGHSTPLDHWHKSATLWKCFKFYYDSKVTVFIIKLTALSELSHGQMQLRDMISRENGYSGGGGA